MRSSPAGTVLSHKKGGNRDTGCSGVDAEDPTPSEISQSQKVGPLSARDGKRSWSQRRKGRGAAGQGSALTGDGAPVLREEAMRDTAAQDALGKRLR